MRAIGLCLLFLFAGCAKQEERTGPEIIPLPPLKKTAPKTPPVKNGYVQFCDRLVDLVGNGRSGFKGLRSQIIEDGWRWIGAVTPEPFLRCEIEGTIFPSATYRCESQGLKARDGSVFDQLFADVQTEIAQCLQKAIWYPGEWQEGQLFEFSGADKQLMWRDVTKQPASAVVLAIGEDIITGRYHLELSVRNLQ